MASLVRDVYISGPLFTAPERAYLEGIDSLCRGLGYSTFLPHRDAGYAKARGKTRREFFQADMRMLLNSRVVVAVLNGADVDAGTAWEVGYAFAKRKPILAIREDLRMNEVNLMLTESATVVSSTRFLKRQLNKVLRPRKQHRPTSR